MSRKGTNTIPESTIEERYKGALSPEGRAAAEGMAANEVPMPPEDLAKENDLFGPVEKPEADDGEGRGMDPEVRVMGQMLRTLFKLPESARGRVARWLFDRYQETQFYKE